MSRPEITLSAAAAAVRSVQPCVSNPHLHPLWKKKHLSIQRQTNEAFCQFAREYCIIICCQVHNRNLITVLTFALKWGITMALALSGNPSTLFLCSPSLSVHDHWWILFLLGWNSEAKWNAQEPSNKSFDRTARRNISGIIAVRCTIVCVSVCAFCFVFLATRYDLILYFSESWESQQLAVIPHCFISHFRLPLFFFFWLS